MKKFAVMLLMLLSATFLKAQTMVVETVDSVESFEVGEIKGLSAFEKKYNYIRIECNYIPILKYEKSPPLINSGYSTRQQLVLFPATTSINDTIISRKNDQDRMNFTFITDKGVSSGAGYTDCYGGIKFGHNNTLEYCSMRLQGTATGCRNPNNNFDECAVHGSFNIYVENIPYIIDSLGVVKGKISGKKILTEAFKLNHSERVSNFGSNGSGSLYQIYIEEIRKTDFTDDSQILITIE